MAEPESEKLDTQELFALQKKLLSAAIVAALNQRQSVVMQAADGSEICNPNPIQLSEAIMSNAIYEAFNVCSGGVVIHMPSYKSKSGKTRDPLVVAHRKVDKLLRTLMKKLDIPEAKWN